MIAHGTVRAEQPTDHYSLPATHRLNRLVRAGRIECDWGECDRAAVAFRFDRPSLSWLPVCDECSTKPEPDDK